MFRNAYITSFLRSHVPLIQTRLSYKIFPCLKSLTQQSQIRRTKRQLSSSCTAGLNFYRILFEVAPQTLFYFVCFRASNDKLCLLFVDSAFEAVAPRLQAYIKVPLFLGIPAPPDPRGAVCADSRCTFTCDGARPCAREREKRLFRLRTLQVLLHGLKH